MGATELGELGVGPVGQVVATGEGLADPGVGGKGLEFASPEEEDAVRYFLTDAGQFHESHFGLRVRQVLGLLEPAWALGQEPGRTADVFGAASGGD
ncbi:MAG: hypothetical protein DRQ40_09540 [Gammaproteobacteria bacterium]|nr:MAG: hypothetical protein DRQ40_09540 [Gammaproteobacteria bacterium]